jgi:signal transduction histidine kinase
MVRAVSKLLDLQDTSVPRDRQQPTMIRTLEVLDEIGRVNKTACERIVATVKSLRNFARLDEAERKRVDLHEGLESTLVLVHHEFKNRIKVVRDYGDEVPEVECSPNQLNQVFMNILVNAAHAIEGEGTVNIATRSEGEQVTISFTDTGRGIDPKVVPNIFDPGFTTKGVGVGTGLGLAICYRIVKDHHGSIDVESEPGRGTTFAITLPTKPAQNS